MDHRPSSDFSLRDLDPEMTKGWRGAGVLPQVLNQPPKSMPARRRLTADDIDRIRSTRDL